MFFRIFKIALLLLVISTTQSFSQSQDDVEKQREEFDKKVKEELDLRIHKFVSQLQADDFQKEIIKQKLNSYYVEQKAIYTNSSLKYFERDQKISDLNNSHFEDIKSMISDDTMDQIQLFIKDVGSTLEKQKKKKKKNKKTKDE